MAKILITGGSGFIGSHLSQALLAQGHHVHVFDPQPFPIKIKTDRFHWQNGDVLDKPGLRQAVNGKDLVIHMAGICEPLKYCRQPQQVMEVTLQGSLNLIKSAAEAGTRILFTSTSEIYGANPALPWAEDATRVLGPTHAHRWCYATVKAAVEHYLYACGQDSGLQFLIVRFFNVYGPRLRGRVASIFLRQALADDPLVIHGNGQQTRSFVYVADVVNCLLRMIERPRFTGRVYNIGSTHEISIQTLAERIIQLTGSHSALRYLRESEVAQGFAPINRRVPNVARVWADYGWRAKTSLTEGLTHTINYLREQIAITCPG